VRSRLLLLLRICVVAFSNGAELVEQLLDGATFKDGIKVTDDKLHPAWRSRANGGAVGVRVAAVTVVGGTETGCVTLLGQLRQDA
jgi:hypothetical protein